MERRRLLGTLAAGVAGFGGCLNREGSDPGRTSGDGTLAGPNDEQSTEKGTPGESASTDGLDEYADVTVGSVTVTPELVGLNSPDSIGTFGDRHEQFVLTTVTAEGASAPDPDTFTLEADKATHAPADSHVRAGLLWDRGGPYTGEDDGWLAFKIPNPLEADTVALTWPGGERALTGSPVTRLRRPPASFEIREFTVPASAQPGEDVTVALTVENVAPAEGTFVAALNRVGPLVAYAPETAVSFDVPAGETTTWEYKRAVPERDVRGRDELSMQFNLDRRGTSLTRTVEIETA